MKPKINDVKNYWYPEYELFKFTFSDIIPIFFNAVDYLISLKNDDVVVADIGCGRGAFMDNIDNDAVSRHFAKIRNYKGRVNKVIGLDVDPEGRNNPTINEFVQIYEDGKLNIPDDSVDIAICMFVVEHLEKPSLFFQEVARILKKGGVICIVTPNKYSYVGAISSLIPNKHHVKVLKKSSVDRKEEDTFPTYYRCNTKKSLRDNMKKSGLKPYVIYSDNDPQYLYFSSLAYSFGALYHKLAPNAIKLQIFAFGVK